MAQTSPLGELIDPGEASLTRRGSNTPEEFKGLASKWASYLKQPEVQAALFQFTSSMFTPGVGFGQALGEAGGAVGRFREQQAAEALQAVEEERKGRAEAREETTLAETIKANQAKRGLEERALGLEAQRLDIAREGNAIKKELTATTVSKAALAALEAELAGIDDSLDLEDAEREIAKDKAYAKFLQRLGTGGDVARVGAGGASEVAENPDLKVLRDILGVGEVEKKKQKQKVEDVVDKPKATRDAAAETRKRREEGEGK